MDEDKRVKPAILISPGYTIKKYMDSRGWTQDDLAKKMDISPRKLSKIIKGEDPIMTDTARLLGDVFKTSSEFWVNLDMINEKQGLKQHLRR